MRPALIALNATTLGRNDHYAALDAARAAGLTAVELTAGRSERSIVKPDMTREDLTAIRERCREKGLQIPALGAHRDLGDAAQLEAYLRLIRAAAFLGCRVITGALPDDAEEGAYYEGLVRAARAAREEGLLLCLENHGYRHGTGCSLLPFLNAGDAVRLCYDTGNCVFYGGAEPCRDLADCAAHVGHMHLKDKGGAPDVWDFPALGEGRVDFAAVLAVPGLSPEVTASIEVEFTQAGADLDETVAAAVRSAAYLRDLLQDMQ